MTCDTVQLLHADCMAVMAALPDMAFDLAIVDPPYGIKINSSGRLGHYGGRGKKWDDGVPTPEYFAELRRVSANQIVWGGNYFELPPTRCFVVWDKQQPEGLSFADSEYAWTSFNASARTFRKRPQRADNVRIHPTQKPVKLYEWLLEKYAKPGQLILDTHLGSGSSAIAAHRFGVNFVGIELDADYYAAAVKRFNDETRA